jgi:hypothetical protein
MNIVFPQELWARAERERKVVVRVKERARPRNEAYGPNSVAPVRATVPCPGDVLSAMQGKSNVDDDELGAYSFFW